MTQLIKTAAFSVDFDRDTRALRAHGALTPMIQPVLKMINQRLAEEKPAQVRLKDIVASTWLPPIPSGPFQRLLLNEARVAIGRPVPQTVSIEVTRLCGAKCDHCLIKEKTGELSREDILRVIDEALKMGACIITFTEGDPLLREDIFELIRYVDPEKAVVNLFTPGLEMTEEKAVKLREAGLYNLIIGIYSTNPEEHDRVRGLEGAHARAVEAIRIALQTGLLVTMSCHIKAGQVDRIAELYKFAADLGVQELSIWEGIPKPGRAAHPDREREDHRHLQKDQLHPGRAAPLCQHLLRGPDAGLHGRKKVAACGSGWKCESLPLSAGELRQYA